MTDAPGAVAIHECGHLLVIDDRPPAMLPVHVSIGTHGGLVAAPSLGDATLNRMPAAERARHLEAELAGILGGDCAVEFMTMARHDHSADDRAALALARQLDPQDPQAAFDRVRQSVMSDMPRLSSALVALSQTVARFHGRLDGLEVTVAIRAAKDGHVLGKLPRPIDYQIGRRLRFERLATGDKSAYFRLWQQAGAETIEALARGGR